MFFSLKKKDGNDKNDKKFYLSHFLTSTISFGVLHTSLICCVFIQYFKDSGMLPLQISIIMVSKRILRLFCDGFFGLLFDRFGAKFVFLTGRLLKLLSYIIVLKFANFYGFVIAMLLDGASYSSIYGKISSYIYNNLSLKKKLDSFPQVMSIYYLCTNFSIAMMTFFAGILLKMKGYDTIIYISIIMNVSSIFILIKYISGYDKNIEKFRSKNFRSIFISLKETFTLKKQFKYLILLYGIVSFMAWQFHGISSLVLLDMKVTSVDLAFYGTFLKITMGLGAVFSIFISSKKTISLTKCINIFLTIIVIGFISAFVYNPYFYYCFCLLLVFSYTTIEVLIEKNFEHYSDKKIRGTSISLAMTFCSVLAMFSNLLVGFIAQYLNYQIGLIVLMFIILSIVLFIDVKNLKLKLF